MGNYDLLEDAIMSLLEIIFIGALVGFGIVVLILVAVGIKNIIDGID